MAPIQRMSCIESSRSARREMTAGLSAVAQLGRSGSGMRDGDRAGRIVFAYDCVAGTHDGRETQRRSSRPTSDATTGIGPYRMQDVRHADDQFGNIGWGGRTRAVSAPDTFLHKQLIMLVTIARSSQFWHAMGHRTSHMGHTPVTHRYPVPKSSRSAAIFP